MIISNASVSALRNPNHGLSFYSASKAAVISLTRSAAMEYAQYGIRVNAVAPGRVVTDMMLRSGIADMPSVARSLPIGRMGHPMEIANLVTWLASDTASYITGQRSRQTAGSWRHRAAVSMVSDDHPDHFAASSPVHARGATYGRDQRQSAAALVIGPGITRNRQLRAAVPDLDQDGVQIRCKPQAYRHGGSS